MLLLVLLFLMLIESSTGIWFARQEMADSVTREDSMLDSAWEKIAEGRKHVVIYPNFDLQVGELLGEAKYWETRWLDLALFASQNEMSTNFGYAPRPLTDYVRIEDSRILKILESGNLDFETVYVLPNLDFWKTVTASSANDIATYDIDGLFVVVSRG
jgi:hypothetical protein